MDRDAPVVAPRVDQEVAAWHAVRNEESALNTLECRCFGNAPFVGQATIRGRDMSINHACVPIVSGPGAFPSGWT